MKNDFLLSLKGLFLFISLSLVVSSCCKNKHLVEADKTDPPYKEEIDLESLFGQEHKDEKIILSTEKRNNSKEYFILNVENEYNDDVFVKFVQVPHHHVLLEDGESFNAIGFIEIYSSRVTNQKNIDFTKEDDNSKLKKYVVNMPKDHLPNVMEVMVYSPQSTKHNYQGSNGNNHSVGHRVKNPW